MIIKIFVFTLLSILLLLSLQVFSQPINSGKNFTFNLASDSRTSAGIYKADGTLIRTLWGNKEYKAGVHTALWDGLADDKSIAPTDNYHVELLKNNVKYKWEGVIGNTSTLKVGGDYDINKTLTGIADMNIFGTKMYITHGWYENHPVIYTKSTTDLNGPMTPVKVRPDIISGKSTTDSNYIYYGGFDGITTNPGRRWIYAIKVSDNSDVVFPNGTTISANPPYRNYPSAIDFKQDAVVKPDLAYSGLSVQWNGKYLFASSYSQNYLHVLNKTTGTLVKNIPFPGITALTTDRSNGLWIATGDTATKKSDTLRKYNIDTASGNFVYSGVMITTGLSRVTYLKVSPDGNTLLAIDAGTNQQVKAFNNTTGVPQWTLGQQGGYLTNADVTNDKFVFGNWPIYNDRGDVNLVEYPIGFVEYQPDGKLWVGDPANGRYLRFNADRTFDTSFGMLPAIYVVNTHPVDPKRVFASGFIDGLEYEMDYTKPLDNGANGSWKLKRNWYASLAQNYEKVFALKYIVQLPNGRTYTVVNNRTRNGGAVELFEMVTGGTLRYTGIEFHQNFQILADGSLVTTDNQTTFLWKKSPLLGFDANNNPQWGLGNYINHASTTYIALPRLQTDPFDQTNSEIAATTATGKQISFDGGTETGYHLGAIELKTDGTVANKFLWRTASSTTNSYKGEFPTDGTYDIGNSVLYSGGGVRVFNGNNIIWSYHGEFWKALQTNFYNHVWENGLPVGLFGRPNGTSAIPIDSGSAGNVQTFGMSKLNDDTAYLYHGDENNHGAVHRWIVSNLKSIRVDTIALGSTLPVDTTKGIDLMYGLIASGTSIIGKLSLPYGGGSGYTSSTTITVSGGNPEIPATVTPTVTNGAITSLSFTPGKNYHSQPTLTISPTPGSGTYIQIDMYSTDTLKNGESGWTRNQVAENNKDADNYWNVIKGTKTYDPFTKNSDIQFKFRHSTDYSVSAITNKLSDIPVQSSVVTRDLQLDVEHNRVYNTTRVNSWKFFGNIDYDGNNYHNSSDTTSNGGGQFIEVLDIDGKVITRFNPKQGADDQTGINKSGFQFNKVFFGLRRTYPDFNSLVRFQKPLSITVDSTGATCSYSDLPSVHTTIYDPTANWQSPKTLRFYFWTWNDTWQRTVAVKDLRFEVNQNSAIIMTPEAPTLSADDISNKLTATHALGNSEILVSENNGVYVAYTGQINVGNVARPAGYWLFKIKAAPGRNESAVLNSPAFTITNTTPEVPVLSADNVSKALSAYHVLGNSEIVVSENSGVYIAYTGQINVGNVARPSGYWLFKIKAAPGRNESAVVNSPAFTSTNTTPEVPALSADNVSKTLSANHALGNSEIVVSENSGVYVAYTGQINVGNVTRPAAYWQFKIKAAPGRNESAVVNSPAFTSTNINPAAVTLVANDAANTLTATHQLGDSAILVCENGGPYLPYTGLINVGNVARPLAYWKFKIKAAPGRNESAESVSPAFTDTIPVFRTLQYRSKNNGNWSNLNTWETSADGTTWNRATKVPDNTDNTITIQNGYTVTIDSIVTADEVTITDRGVLQIAPNATLVVANGPGDDIIIKPSGSLVIKSDSTGTGNIGNSAGTINGSVVVERFILSKRANRFLTAPVNTINDMKANWMENANNTSTAVNYNPSPGYGTHISGIGGAANGFDATATNSSSLLTFNNETQVWEAATSTTVPMKAGNPYLIMVRGDRNTDLNNNNALSSTTTLRATGTVITGNVSLTKQGSGGTPGMPTLSSVIGNCSFVANPYAAGVDWRRLQKNDIANTIYYYDPSITGGNKIGAYVSYNDVLGTVSVLGSKVDNNIQSGQAFFVQTTGPNPSLTFSENSKSSTQRSIFREASTIPHLSVKLLLPYQEGTPDVADGFAAYFADHLNSDVADDDSYKYANPDENIGIVRNGKILSIEGRKPATAADTLPIKIWQLSQTKYTLKINVSNFAGDVVAYLQDRYLQTQTLLDNNAETIVRFSLNKDLGASASPNRFNIIFKPALSLPVHITGVKAKQVNKEVLVEWNTATEENMDRYEVERSVDGNAFSNIGVVKSKGNAIAAGYHFTDANPVQGKNYYRIKSVDKSGEVHYTNVAYVKYVVTEDNHVTILNPIINNTLSIQSNNLPGGLYAVSLVNNLGQVVFKQSIKHSAGTSIQALALPGNLSKGVYIFHLSGNSLEVNKKLLK